MSILIATFGFSMLGFLATVITILIALSDKLHMKTYKRRGHQGNFLIFYFWTITNLFFVFLNAVWSLGKHAHPLVFDFMIIGFINTLAETALIGIIIFNLLRHSVSTQQ